MGWEIPINGSLLVSWYIILCAIANIHGCELIRDLYWNLYKIIRCNHLFCPVGLLPIWLREKHKFCSRWKQWKTAYGIRYQNLFTVCIVWNTDKTNQFMSCLTVISSVLTWRWLVGKLDEETNCMIVPRNCSLWNGTLLWDVCKYFIYISLRYKYQTLELETKELHHSDLWHWIGFLMIPFIFHPRNWYIQKLPLLWYFKWTFIFRNLIFMSG